MKNDSTPHELILNGTFLCNDEKIGELVAHFKKELAGTPDIPVLLDLRKLSSIYSKGISIILGVYKDCTASHRELKILVSADDIYTLFKMLKLDKVLTIQKVDK